jgi:hypothetical protein
MRPRPFLLAMRRPWTEIMHKNILVLIMLGMAGACAAQESRSSDARPSMPFAGTATMLDDGTLSLHLRVTSDGKPVDDIITYKVSDHAYDDILRHVGGLRPGDAKPFRPWKD